MYISILKENQRNETTKNEIEDKTKTDGEKAETRKRQGERESVKVKEKSKLVAVKNCGQEDQEWKQGLSDRGAEQRRDN